MISSSTPGRRLSAWRRKARRTARSVPCRRSTAECKLASQSFVGGRNPGPSKHAVEFGGDIATAVLEGQHRNVAAAGDDFADRAGHDGIRTIVQLATAAKIFRLPVSDRASAGPRRSGVSLFRLFLRCLTRRSVFSVISVVKLLLCFLYEPVATLDAITVDEIAPIHKTLTGRLQLHNP